MLSPYRVLDLTTHQASLGPMLLADMEAEVIRIEPPGGASDRSAAPLAPDGAASTPKTSLLFTSFNRNKRFVEIDLASADGREAFLELVRGADFVVESMGAGAMNRLGLGWEELRAVQPGLVYVAISPFGQDGPHASHLATDLTIAAMGGNLALNGDNDRPPVRISVPQMWLHAAAESAAAALVGHFRRMQTGEGQFVDVSVQAAAFWTMLNAMIAGAIDKDIERAGTLLQLGVIDLQLCFPAADGEVVVAPLGAFVRQLLPWMIERGVIDESWLTAEDWTTYDLRVLRQIEITITPAMISERLAAFASQMKKRDLFDGAFERKTTIAPVSTMADVLALPHFEDRGYWREIADLQTSSAPTTGPDRSASRAPSPPDPLSPRGGGEGEPPARRVLAPGAWVRFGETPISFRHEAAEAPVPVKEITRRSPAAIARSGSGDLPFEGMKVADFSWIGVGPITAKYFADHGATVVRVESNPPADRLRGAGPHKDGKPGINRSQFYGGFNSSKLGININLKEEGGKKVARDLLAWCDVAFESFTPGTMASLGIGYDTARELNPGIIMASSCLMGQTGRNASLAGYGYHAAAICGFYEVTGWDDRAPSGPFNAYTDVIAPHFLSAAVMAALDHRRRTGHGQHIEQAQMESALHFLAPQLLDFQVSGHQPRRCGNDDPEMAPHNVYPCTGTDQWVAIAIENDAQWRSLQSLLCDQGWIMESRFDTAAGRLEHRREIDGHLGRWTAGQDRYAVMERLQAIGVPAGVVQRSSDLLTDPQFAHRNFYKRLEHPEMGLVPYEGHMFRIAGYDNGPRFPAPCLGEHTFEVLTELLGKSVEEAAELTALGGVG